MPDHLAGGNAWNQTWDEYDRLIKVTRTGLDDIHYTYDALGPMIRREVKTAGTSTVLSTIYFYWVGLNMIAQETESSFFPDSESDPDPVENGWWDILSHGGTADYVWDSDLGTTVTELQGPAEEYMHWAIGDFSGEDINPNDAVFDTASVRVSFRAKNEGAEPMDFNFIVRDAADDPFVLTVHTVSGTDYADGSAYHVYLGDSPDLNDGEWHAYELNLAALFARVAAGTAPSFARADLFSVSGEDLDMLLSGLEFTAEGFASRQLVPGAAIGGYLGTHAAGGDRWWYHYNDLGTVLATTDPAGDPIGIHEPDFFGNYRTGSLIDGTRRDSLGLDSKFQDFTGLYYFGFRWLDPERGRWMSREPNGDDGPNLYNFLFNKLADYVDVDGRKCCNGEYECYLYCAGDPKGPLVFCGKFERCNGFPISEELIVAIWVDRDWNVISGRIECSDFFRSPPREPLPGA